MNVVIIGGGPGGSSAAIQCCNLGLNVTLLEIEGCAGIKPGETLHPGTQAVFKRLGVQDKIESSAIVRHSATWIKWSGELELLPFGSDERGPWFGYQVLRRDLDLILQQRAQRLGANIKRSCRAIGLRIDAGKIVGVKTSTGEIEADFVIDAAGPSHWIARKLGLKIRRYSPLMTVYYGYASGKCPVRDKAPALVATNNGWIWTARVHKDLYQWIRLDFQKAPISADWLPSEFAGLRSVHNGIHGSDASWRRVIGIAGEKYFIVGDAAAVLDPTSSHGILRAVMSGMATGHSIARITKLGYSEQVAAYEYEKWFTEWFLYDVAILRKLYLQHPYCPVSFQSNNNLEELG